MKNYRFVTIFLLATAALGLLAGCAQQANVAPETAVSGPIPPGAKTSPEKEMGGPGLPMRSAASPVAGGK